MSILKQWKGVNGYMIRDPGTFFSEYDETHGAGYPLAFMLLSFLATMLPFAALVMLFNLASPADAAIGIVVALIFGIVAWIFGVIEALVAHVIASLFGGRGASLTLEAYAFPTLIRSGLWWLPVIGWATGFYGWYLQIKGLAAFHDISTGKAVVAAVIAVILYIPAVIIIAAVIAAFVLDLGNPPETQPAMLLLDVLA
ncbi:YIP1 family protein [Natrinema versiforme]|uniref:Yip1 domain-containing protein n=1 Tax=Natrinema versiforme TaxID=88724 RepID=A0A4P8WNG0_9EURY|nr:YIP1 family protein [Natrinema versiforme]QCS43581.1 hypothetical protein FEJ81_14935 [Natrinema versiforme]